MPKAKKKHRFATLVVLLVIAIVGFAYLPELYKMLYPLKYTEYVEKYAEEYDMDPHFIYAVIRTESRFRPDAVSHVGASGLMQLMPDSFAWIKTKLGDKRDIYYEKDIFDPEINIQYGTYMLSILYREFQDRDVTVMAYHAGRGKIQQWLQNRDYSSDGKTIHTIPEQSKETKNYLNNVNKAYEIYAKLYQDQ